MRRGSSEQDGTATGVCQSIAQLAITYLPTMNRVFQTAPLGAGAWLRIAGLAGVISLAVAGEKYLRARK